MRFAIVLMALLPLAACQTTQKHPLLVEADAWEKGEIISSKKCLDGKGGEEALNLINRKNVQEINACLNKVSDQEVRPKVVYLDLFMERRNRQQTLVNQYKDGKISKESFKEKIQKNFETYIIQAYDREIKTASNIDICLRWNNNATDTLKNEIKRRGVDCYQTIALYQQQIGIQQQQQQAQSAALMNLGNQIQQQSYQQQMLNSMNRPVNTNCFRTPMGMNCTSY